MKPFKKLLITVQIFLFFGGIVTAQDIISPTYGKAVIYFVQTSYALPQLGNVLYFEKDNYIGNLGTNTFMRYECDPGKSLFWMKRGSNVKFLETDLAAGSTYMIEILINDGYSGMAIKLIDFEKTNQVSRLVRCFFKNEERFFTEEELKDEEVVIEEERKKGLGLLYKKRTKGAKTLLLDADMTFDEPTMISTSLSILINGTIERLSKKEYLGREYSCDTIPVKEILKKVIHRSYTQHTKKNKIIRDKLFQLDSINNWTDSDIMDYMKKLNSIPYIRKIKKYGDIIETKKVDSFAGELKNAKDVQSCCRIAMDFRQKLENNLESSNKEWNQIFEIIDADINSAITNRQKAPSTIHETNLKTRKEFDSILSSLFPKTRKKNRIIEEKADDSIVCTKEQIERLKRRIQNSDPDRIEQEYRAKFDQKVEMLSEIKEWNKRAKKSYIKQFTSNPFFLFLTLENIHGKISVEIITSDRHEKSCMEIIKELKSLEILAHINHYEWNKILNHIDQDVSDAKNGVTRTKPYPVTKIEEIPKKDWTQREEDKKEITDTNCSEEHFKKVFGKIMEETEVKEKKFEKIYESKSSEISELKGWTEKETANYLLRIVGMEPFRQINAEKTKLGRDFFQLVTNLRLETTEENKCDFLQRLVEESKNLFAYNAKEWNFVLQQMDTDFKAVSGNKSVSVPVTDQPINPNADIFPTALHGKWIDDNKISNIILEPDGIMKDQDYSSDEISSEISIWCTINDQLWIVGANDNTVFFQYSIEGDHLTLNLLGEIHTYTRSKE